ncbi:MAG: hypothetical protein IJV62_04085, partial [Eggerthellaceae bacterium]|nr:hypothetical protein [Eggerthellaceae bacterium]
MEKRFSIARAGIAGLASLALACGLATTAPYAFAETGEKGTIKVTKADGNDGGYTAIQIFTGDVESGAINGAAWASDAAQTAVLGAITAADPTFTETSAPAAAQKLVELFGGAAGDAYILEDTDFGKAFADALKGLSGTALASGTAVELPEGYVVVLSDSATTKQGTSAIFRAIEKGAAVEINEKATVPTVEKTVADDKSGNTKEADAQIGQEL